MLENLAAKGVKRITPSPRPDLQTVKDYHPEAVCALGLLADLWGFGIKNLFAGADIYPDWLVSGYRDRPADAKVLNSPHYFGVAFDVMVGGWKKQVEFVRLATESNLFFRGGVYIGRNTCHIDRCDRDWMRKYNGAKYWVWEKGNYHGFENIGDVMSRLLKYETK